MKKDKTKVSEKEAKLVLNRRDLLKWGLLSGGAILGSGALSLTGLRGGTSKAFAASGSGGTSGGGGEAFPTSPLILSPFSQELPVPRPLGATNPGVSWNKPAICNYTNEPISSLRSPSGGPMPGLHQSDGTPYQRYRKPAYYYRIPTYRAPHNFPNSLVQPIDANGNPITPPDGITGNRVLPPSWMSAFNGTFPGPLIIARYGAPVMVRFECLLNPNDRWYDYGVPSQLTHLHNGHTAPECDGNPFYTMMEGYDSAYVSSQRPWYYDNLYLNAAPDNDDREKQSFLWFHDHRMANTGSNVYSGMVGLYLIYDNMDTGNETKGFRLPGVWDTDGHNLYDIPLAFYDVRLDDGVTPHNGLASTDYPTTTWMQTPNQDGLAHPEWWGEPFYGHYNESGFVGDIFTVNGVANPVLHVKRRKYRFRFLDCSISRVYEFSLRQGQLQAVPGQQGQYNLVGGGQQCMRFTQIASEGGLIPRPIIRDSFRLPPAKRREFVVDFTRYQDGSRVSIGDEIYLTNILEMTDGKKPNGTKAGYGVPVLKFIVDGDPPVPDRSLIPARLRDLPPVPRNFSGLVHRQFELKKTNNMWVVRDLATGREGFDPAEPFATPKLGSAELWTISTGGGWSHPMHMHQEEHHVVSRNGVPSPSDPLHVDDNSKEDVVNLEPGESVTVYRKFRSYLGSYVSHCHNLIHEDHNMMFPWKIVP